MKKLKHIVRTFSKILFHSFLITCIVASIISLKVKSQLINNALPTSEAVTDTIILHFIHGSVPKKNCSYQKRRLGGHMGGHVEIEFAGSVYGFNYGSLPIHIFPKKSFNSTYEVRPNKLWTNYRVHDKITSIYIPIDPEQKARLGRILNKYVDSAPYDYSFWGQRCTSSAAELLSDAGVFNQFNNFESKVAFFYPRSLRHTLLKFASTNDLKVNVQPGIECHDWE
jgi:hypothetical protein